MKKLIKLIKQGELEQAEKEADRLISQLEAYESVLPTMHRKCDEANAKNAYLVNLIKKAQANDGRLKGSDINHALTLSSSDVLMNLIIQQRIAGISALAQQLNTVLPMGGNEIRSVSIKAGSMIACLSAHQNPNINHVIVFDGDRHVEH